MCSNFFFTNSQTNKKEGMLELSRMKHMSQLETFAVV